jgi:hypothetical protein
MNPPRRRLGGSSPTLLRAHAVRHAHLRGPNYVPRIPLFLQAVLQHSWSWTRGGLTCARERNTTRFARPFIQRQQSLSLQAKATARACSPPEADSDARGPTSWHGSLILRVA